MNTSAKQFDQKHGSAAAKAGPLRPASGKLDQQKQQFRSMIEPLVYRARQLGLNRVQIREIITSLL